ncbi:MAG: amino acid ABC transporter permease [Alphaproteobacteria bacterium]|nr:amino acid ABC transporter permease [Alphaproteobacteria bacterium]
MSYAWDWSALWDNLPLLLGGIRITVLASFASMAASLILALPIALLRISGRWAGAAAHLYTELFRNLPLLVLVLWVFTVLPLLTGLTLSPLLSGVVALTLNLSAFIAEIYRAGITSIAPGQSHAALALGMTRQQLYKRIVLPQAIMRVLPALGSMWVSLFKDTSILSVIGVGELMYEGRLAATDTYRPLEIFTGVAVIYYLLAYPQSLGVNWLFDKFQVQE